MDPTCTADRLRTRIWTAMAELFLDTETRTWIPAAAMACLEAGCDVPEARNIWCYEVTPAVYHNIYEVAGEWALWPDDWLIAEIERLRGRWPNRPGADTYLIYRKRVNGLHGFWLAIERCMQALLAVPERERRGLTADLTRLARHYFNFGIGEPVTLSEARRRELAATYRTVFLPIFQPLIVNSSDESRELCEARVTAITG
jgi:hypothetical protein